MVDSLFSLSVILLILLLTSHGLALADPMERLKRCDVCQHSIKYLSSREKKIPLVNEDKSLGLNPNEINKAKAFRVDQLHQILSNSCQPQLFNAKFVFPPEDLTKECQKFLEEFDDQIVSLFYKGEESDVTVRNKICIQNNICKRLWNSYEEEAKSEKTKENNKNDSDNKNKGNIKHDSANNAAKVKGDSIQTNKDSMGTEDKDYKNTKNNKDKDVKDKEDLKEEIVKMNHRLKKPSTSNINPSSIKGIGASDFEKFISTGITVNLLYDAGCSNDPKCKQLNNLMVEVSELYSNAANSEKKDLEINFSRTFIDPRQNESNNLIQKYNINRLPTIIMFTPIKKDGIKYEAKSEGDFNSLSLLKFVNENTHLSIQPDDSAQPDVPEKFILPGHQTHLEL